MWFLTGNYIFLQNQEKTVHLICAKEGLASFEVKKLLAHGTQKV
jgi:hypothetical protein